jgi:pyrroloquinoline quinone (PQQ) biosynthesis protein C
VKITVFLSFFYCVLSYYRLGENADEKDAEEIIDLASKASVADQEKQVQDNVHYQLSDMCQTMDSILRPDVINDPSNDPSEAQSHSRRSGLSFAVGGAASANNQR